MSTVVSWNGKKEPCDQCDSYDSQNQPPIEKTKIPSAKTDEKVEKITRNEAPKAPEKNYFEIGEGKKRVTASQKSQSEYEKEVERQKDRFDTELGGHSESERHSELPPYVHRRSTHPVMWYCDYCSYSDDKFGMAKHSHSEEEMKKKKK